ncbi:hypothetical protein C1646_767819 [Rhizophagus diaphanus]|nr:hypothetical protein C1646_767819 [Rhizophagus diaphanus] [Rhizophagus sp. MUCL 43196]
MVANNTRHECDQILKDLLSQENHLQLNQEDIQQLMLWIIEWEHTKGIKKQDLKKKIPVYQCIAYEQIPTQQKEGDAYDLKGRKILQHNEQ